MNVVYRSLSAFKPVSKSYTFKFLFIAFLGIHIPLIGLIILILLSPGALPSTTVLLLALICTLGATAATLYILNMLLAPLKMSKAALEDYLTQRKMPNLPKQYQDEAGILMQKIEETVRSLDMLLEEKKDLIGLLSHDLRTPLASILLFSSSLEKIEVMSDEERREIAAGISASVREQMSLFQRILELLRNDDINTLQLQLENIDLGNTIENCVTGMQTLAQQKNITINVHSLKAHTIKADKNLLQQVFKNLISNAIKFSFPDSSVDIHIFEKGEELTVSINDKGLGFEPYQAEKIFQRFTSHRKMGTANEVSTGMGLYLSNKIMKAHNGMITARSSGKNKGSEFNITLMSSAN